MVLRMKFVIILVKKCELLVSWFSFINSDRDISIICNSGFINLVFVFMVEWI